MSLVNKKDSDRFLNNVKTRLENAYWYKLCKDYSKIKSRKYTLRKYKGQFCSYPNEMKLCVLNVTGPNEEKARSPTFFIPLSLASSYLSNIFLNSPSLFIKIFSFTLKMNLHFCTLDFYLYITV